jgi:alcohol dehydrogenase
MEAVMKAAQITQYGDANVVNVIHDVPRPSAGEGKVLVEVHAAGLNPVDSKVRSGFMHQVVAIHFPATLGTDISGIVVEGANVFPAGERVFGTASVLAGASGAFAEYASVPAGALAKVPADLDFIRAASLPLAGVSAVQGIVEVLNVDKGDTVLVLGGSGGIGTIAVQIAKRMGARVVATCRGPVIDYVKSLGADQVMDIKDFPGSLRDCDAVFDTAGGAAYKSAFTVLKKGGTIVTMAGMPDSELAAKYGVTAVGQMTDVTTGRLNTLAAFIADGTVKPCIDRVFPLDNIRDAFLAREAGHLKGKIVLKIRE